MEGVLLLIMIIIMFLFFFNMCSYEYMKSEPYGFIPDGYGDKGQYYDNIKIEPLYRLF